MRYFINIIMEALKESVDTPSLLILVHPGSACGSANMHLGKYEAEAGRDGLVHDLHHNTGGILVVDGSLSDELAYYSSLDRGIKMALDRASEKGLPSLRIFACDDETPDWPALVGTTLRGLGLPPETEIKITGAWASNGTSGCVNAVERVVKRIGLRGSISDMAIFEPDEDEDEDEDGDEQD